MNRGWRLFAVLCIAALDQGTKALALTQLSPDETLSVLPFLNLRISSNFGIAFGVLNSSQINNWLVLAPVSGILLGFLYWLMLERQLGIILGLSLIVGGALGNVIDRLRQGAVTDFVDIFAGTYHWPTFNLADTFLFCGVVIVLAYSVRNRSAHAGE